MNPMDGITDRDLLISMQGDLERVIKTVDELVKDGKQCDREVRDKLHEFDLFRASIVATGLADEKDLIEKARKEAAYTARTWSLVISVITLSVTTGLTLWLSL